MSTSAFLMSSSLYSWTYERCALLVGISKCLTEITWMQTVSWMCVGWIVAIHITSTVDLRQSIYTDKRYRNTGIACGIHTWKIKKCHQEWARKLTHRKMLFMDFTIIAIFNCIRMAQINIRSFAKHILHTHTHTTETYGSHQITIGLVSQFPITFFIVSAILIRWNGFGKKETNKKKYQKTILYWKSRNELHLINDASLLSIRWWNAMSKHCLWRYFFFVVSFDWFLTEDVISKR